MNCHRVDQARVRYWQARTLLACDALGGRERALKLLADARTLSESMGMRGLVEGIDALRREPPGAADGSESAP